MLRYQTPNILPGLAHQPQNYDGYYSGYPLRKLPEATQGHPLIYEKRLKRTFRNCKGDVNGPGYKFDACCIVLDVRYSNEIFYEEKMSGFHPAPLVKYSLKQKK